MPQQRTAASRCWLASLLLFPVLLGAPERAGAVARTPRLAEALPLRPGSPSLRSPQVTPQVSGLSVLSPTTVLSPAAMVSPTAMVSPAAVATPPLVVTPSGVTPPSFVLASVEGPRGTPVLVASLPAGTAAVADPRLLALLPADLQALARELQAHGFRLRLAPPPAAGAYGQFVPATRTLWLAPIAFELGIGRQTFLHEAVHAVQSCPTGRLTPIGWRLVLDPVVSREISGILVQRYHHGSRLLEQEAFGLQGQPDAVTRLRAALRSRCRGGS